MSDPSIIDYLARDETRNKLVLIISEDRPWQDTRTMHRQLKAKIDSYYGYIMDPAFAKEYPGTRPSDVVITLFCKNQPTPESLQFFQYVQQTLAQDQIVFNHVVHSHPPPDGSSMIH